MLAEKFHDVKFEAGCDEAGRGCLAGSVFAAAVIFPQGYANEEIKIRRNFRQRNAMLCVKKYRKMLGLGLWVRCFPKK